MLTSADLAAYITHHSIQAVLVPMTVHTPTVADAAQALSVHPEQIIKSIVFLIDGKPHLVIACGLGRVSQGMLAGFFGLGKKRIRLASPDDVLTITGYPVGTMPPFGHAYPLPTLLDQRILDQEEVFGGGGAIDYLLRIKPDELLRVTQALAMAITE